MSDLKMKEIDQLITNVNSDLCIFNRTSEANILSLITTIESQNSQIESLKAITELAVKGLEEIASNIHTNHVMAMKAKLALGMIEKRLSHAQT